MAKRTLEQELVALEGEFPLDPLQLQERDQSRQRRTTWSTIAAYVSSAPLAIAFACTLAVSSRLSDYSLSYHLGELVGFWGAAVLIAALSAVFPGRSWNRARIAYAVVMGTNAVTALPKIIVSAVSLM